MSMGGASLTSRAVVASEPAGRIAVTKRGAAMILPRSAISLAKCALL